MEKHHKKKIIQWTVGVGAGVVVLIVLAGFWLYSGAARGARLQALQVLRAPLGVVGSEYITAGDLQYFSDDVSGVQTEAAASALVHALQVKSIAAGRGLHVSSSDLQRAARELQAGDGQYKSFEAHYGQAAAIKVLVEPYVYENYLRIDYMKQGLEPVLTQQLRTLSAGLQSDDDWKVAASTHSDDLASSWSGGDVGYVDLGLAIPEYAQAVQGLPLHNPAVIYTRYGAHIVEVLNRVTKDEKELTQLREIVLRPKHFDAWLTEQTTAVPVKWYVQVPTSIE